MRRFFLILFLWAGIAAPSWAMVTQYYSSSATASAACGGSCAFQTNASAGWCGTTGYNMWYKFGPDTAYCYLPSGGCTAGNIPDATGHCVAQCEFDPQLTATDPACVAPPTCPEGQSGNPCTPTAPAPTAGDPAPEIGIEFGTVDAAGNHTYSGAAQQTLMTGGSLTYNCGGWECTVAIANFSGGANGCTYPTSGGALVCNFVPVYTGVPAAIGNPLPSSAGSVGGSYVAPAPAGCPAGYVLNDSGICVSGATSGSASTPTTAGTSATLGTGSCPAGYTANSSGICSGPPSSGPISGPSGNGCPAGYNLVGGQCVGTSAIGSGAGTGSPTSTAPCGAPGQPPCSVVGVDIPDSFDVAASQKAAGAAAGNSIGDQIEGVSGKSVPHGWTWGFSSLMLPAAACSPWVMATGGRSMTIDYCPIAQKISELGAYVLYVLTVIGLFNILTGRTETSA